jgi:hypothetical protein
MTAKLLLAIAVFVCVPVLDVTIDPGAAAARPNARRIRRAKHLFKQAEIKYRLGEFATALSLYKKALSLARRPSLVFNIAQCHRFLEHPKKALFYYELYLSEWKRSRPGTDPPNLAEVQGFITSLREQLATPKLLIEGLPDGAEVLVDGRVIGRLPMEAAVEISPGDHQLRVKASGYRTYRRLISLRPGQQLTRRIKLRHRRHPPKRSVAWLATGIAASALAIGAEVAALVLTKKTNDQFDDTPEFKQYRNGAIISHIGAATMAVTAGVSFVLYAYSGKERRDARLSTGPRLVVSPHGAEGAMISATGTF